MKDPEQLRKTDLPLPMMMKVHVGLKGGCNWVRIFFLIERFLQNPNLTENWGLSLVGTEKKHEGNLLRDRTKTDGDE